MCFPCSKLDVSAYSVCSTILRPIALDYSCDFSLQVSFLYSYIHIHTYSPQCHPSGINFYINLAWSLTVLETISISLTAEMNKNIISTEKLGFLKVGTGQSQYM